jgi:hypothetical protein
LRMGLRDKHTEQRANSETKNRLDAGHTAFQGVSLRSHLITRSARASTFGGIHRILDFRWFDFAHHRFWISKSPYSSRFTPYRITWSALANTLGGIVTPICLAVFRLITSSNLVGCSTGKSAGLAPLRILST